MSKLTVTSKGQVTLRKDLLKHLGVAPGGEVDVEMLPDGRIEVRATQPTGDISDVFDFLKQDGRRALSIDDMNEIAARGWAGEWRRSRRNSDYQAMVYLPGAHLRLEGERRMLAVDLAPQGRRGERPGQAQAGAPNSKSPT